MNLNDNADENETLNQSETPSPVKKEKNVGYFKKLFPYKKNVNYENLKITKVGRYSISHRFDSNFLSKMIRNLYNYLKQDPKNIVITDATAGIGGNSISFGIFFGKVNAIELDDVQINALKHNVDQFRLSNVEIFEGSCLKLIPDLKQDVIFVDPPWGGKDYKLKDQLNLYLDDQEIVDITNNWYENANFIFVKIPKNFVLKEFVEKSSFKFFYIFNLRKYDILMLSKRICRVFKYNKLDLQKINKNLS